MIGVAFPPIFHFPLVYDIVSSHFYCYGLSIVPIYSNMMYPATMYCQYLHVFRTVYILVHVTQSIKRELTKVQLVLHFRLFFIAPSHLNYRYDMYEFKLLSRSLLTLYRYELKQSAAMYCQYLHVSRTVITTYSIYNLFIQCNE